MKRISYLIVFVASICSLSGQQVSKYQPITLNAYLKNVSKGNLGYIAEQFNVNIAEAGLKAAKVFPDPEISATYSNNQDKTLHMGQGIETEITYPVSTGNKRQANISLASSQHELSKLILDEYFINLRADAALSYFSALKLTMAYKLQEDTYKQLQKLAQSDSLRLVVGEANEIDAMQSALEAKASLNDVYQSKSEMENALINLARLQGRSITDTLFRPSDNFPVAPRLFVLSELIENAIKNKGAVKIAIKNKEVSEKYLRLLKANRAFEFSVEAGYSYNSIVTNDIAPAPAFNSYSAGITIPLKLSNTNKGSIQAARFAVEQSETNYRDIESQIITDVTQAHNTFMTEKSKIGLFDRGLIDNAEKILKGRIYQYQRGESGLIDVINAQHTYNSLRNDYLEALYGYVSSLVELERAAGIWDL
jgi:outer membrane protein, heavy metal efflux system